MSEIKPCPCGGDWQCKCDNAETEQEKQLKQQLAEAMELLELAGNDLGQVMWCVETCSTCANINRCGNGWQWQHTDRLNKLREAVRNG